MSSNSITVSVIIPVYNAEKYIEECINSCLKQDLNNDELEVIAVDDQSSDSSEKILKELSMQHENVIYTKLPKNRGPAAARNEGLKLANGKFIAFLDSDDYMTNEKIKIQISKFQANPDVDIIITGLEEIDEEGKHIRNFIQDFPTGKLKQAKAFFLDEISSVTPTIILKKKIIKDVGIFDEELIHFEDKEFLLRVLKTHTIAYISRPLTIRRVTQNSFSNTVNENTFIESRKRFFDLAVSYFPSLESFTKEYWQRQMFGLGRIYQKRGDYKRARKYYRKSLDYLVSKKGILGLMLSYFPVSLQKMISSLRF